MRHCLTFSFLSASKEQWKARRRHNKCAHVHWLHATTCYDVTYDSVSGRCRGSSKEAFCLTSMRFLSDSHLRSTVSLQMSKLRMANDAIFDDFWMSLRASFDAANPKGSKWMWCSESLLRNMAAVLKKHAQSKQDQQNFLLWLSLIRLAQTGVTTKQMITNATIAGKFCSPPNSSITRLALTTWRAHVDEVTTWKFFFVSRIETKNIKQLGKFGNQTSLRLRSKIWKIHENSTRRKQIGESSESCPISEWCVVVLL